MTLNKKPENIMIESIDFKNPVSSLSNSGFLHIQHYRDSTYDLMSSLLEQYLTGKAYDIQQTEASINIIFPDQTIFIPFDPNKDDRINSCVMVGKLNMLFQQYEIPVRIYGMYYNINPIYDYFICKPSEAASVFRLFEQNKIIRIAISYYRLGFVLPQGENSRESIVYNLNTLCFSEEEYNFLITSGFSLLLLLIVADLIGEDCRESLKVLHKYSEENELLDEYVNGIIFRGGIYGDHAEEVYRTHSGGYYSFATVMYEVYRNEASSVVPDTFILKLDSQFEVLNYRHTNGINYNVSTSDIIEKLKKWDQKYGLTIEGVDYDWVDFKLHQVPDDLEDFANELYVFCPDCIDQGVGNMEELKEAIRKKKYICLWWD